MLAEATSLLIARAPQADLFDWFAQHRGIYHLAGNGFATRYELAVKALGLDPNQHEHICKQVLEASTDEFPAPAERPAFSALDCTRFSNTFGFTLPDWETALSLALSG
jgi:dTDP-4-dehydrorhamnose reductase